MCTLVQNISKIMIVAMKYRDIKETNFFVELLKKTKSFLICDYYISMLNGI